MKKYFYEIYNIAIYPIVQGWEADSKISGGISLQPKNNFYLRGGVEK